MTKDEILKKLESLGLITVINSMYFITEKYKELLSKAATIPLKSEIPVNKQLLDYDEILNTDGSATSWPSDIEHTTGRTRAEAFMNAANIPEMGGIAPRVYRLRGLPKECLTIIDNIINNKDVSPISMIKAIEIYYKYTEMPKSFKNLLLEGEVINLYHEYIKGTLIKNIKPKDNTSQKWN